MPVRTAVTTPITKLLFMARIPSVASLTKRLAEKKLYDTNLKIRQAQSLTDQNSRVGKGQKNPTDPFKYKSIFTSQDMILNASRAAVAFFGDMAALGLAAPDASPRLARGFKPAKVRATIGREGGGVEKTADLSKRRYLKYSIDAITESARGTYTAPISGDSVATLKTKYQAIVTAKKVVLKEYGRISFIPEVPLFSSTGTDSSPAVAP